jgi:hypothetical protein
MVEPRPWGTSPEQPEQLKQKINAYAGYILDGTLISTFPQMADQPVRIHLDCVQAPSPEIATIVDWAAGQLRAYDIAITVNVQS